MKTNKHGLPVFGDGHHRRRPKRSHEIGMALAYNTTMESRARRFGWEREQKANAATTSTTKGN